DGPLSVPVAQGVGVALRGLVAAHSSSTSPGPNVRRRTGVETDWAAGVVRLEVLADVAACTSREKQCTPTGTTSGRSPPSSNRISYRGNDPPQSRQVMVVVLPAGSLLTHIRLCPILVSVNSEREKSDGQDPEPHPREDQHEGAPCATRHDATGVRGRAARRAYHGAQLGAQGKPAVRPRSAGAREAGRVLDRGPVRGHR